MKINSDKIRVEIVFPENTRFSTDKELARAAFRKAHPGRKFCTGNCHLCEGKTRPSDKNVEPKDIEFCDIVLGIGLVEEN